MKIITVECKAKPEKRIEVIELCKGMLEPSRAESGCVTYRFYQETADENAFFFYEEWKDQAAVEYHTSSDHYRVFQMKFPALLQKDAVVTIHSVD